MFFFVGFVGLRVNASRRGGAEENGSANHVR
jgi:hypothetical protein